KTHLETAASAAGSCFETGTATVGAARQRLRSHVADRFVMGSVQGRPAMCGSAATKKGGDAHSKARRTLSGGRSDTLMLMVSEARRLLAPAERKAYGRTREAAAAG